ncbi:MAG: porin [Pseudolabrys sp.]|nr:porin [Pseudolabrys sp.]
MKMVKSLLLGSAAGLVAIASAQAADLPVKAKPVQYVKICSLYGAGFYYIPGTDICLKVGGWTRFEYAWGSNGSFAWGPFNANAQTRATNNSVFRARGYITADARSQTAYGTVRSYIAVGISENDVGLNTAANTFSANRAFIQWAGFTFGRATSFFDFYNVPATSYWGAFPASDMGDPGWMVAAYTAQFGGGFSASISAEERRMSNLIGASNAATGVAGAGYGGFQSPDYVANLRIDQAWGSAQIMGAMHQVNGLYYGGAAPGTGHPGDKWGYAVGAGIKLNAPMIGAGDYFQAQINYAEGASRYVFATPNSNWFKGDGANGAFGILSDGVYGGAVGAGATGVELTKTWGFNAAYEHFWNPAWKTSVYGGYAAVRYNGTANNMLCGGVVGVGLGANAPVVAGCDNNWSTWWLGSRTQWNVTKDFYMGLDVLYSNLTSAKNAAVLAIANTSNQDNVAIRFRVHRDFMP